MVKVGDIILNKWAGETNPTKISMIYKITSKYVKTICRYKLNGKNKIYYATYDKSMVKKEINDKFIILGHVDIFGELEEYKVKR